MKKNGILNSEIATILAQMGHTDKLVIADCGLPIPDEVKRIDLALKPGAPSFIETLEVVLTDFEVEKATMAGEVKLQNKNLHQQVRQQLQDIQTDYCDHESLKEQLKEAKAVIRTGEASPYANVILRAGVIF